jgi:hypothetical protein
MLRDLAHYGAPDRGRTARRARPGVTGLILTISLLGSMMLAAPPALAGNCPNNFSGYSHQRSFSNNAGDVDIGWINVNGAGGPCLYVGLYNTPGVSNCVEGIFDWDTHGAGHYDARDFVSCRNGVLKDRVIDETNREEHWQDIAGYNRIGICKRNEAPTGTNQTNRFSCSNEGLYDVHENPITSTADFYVWNNAGVFTNLEGGD